MGIPEIANAAVKRFVETRPCVVLAPDYRKAFDHPYPAGLNDCYDTLLWARANAEALGVDPDKIIVAGHSGGGGLTAAVTLKARDAGDFKIAFQMPIYPMIDDQQPNDPERAIDSPSWNTEMNSIGWGAYLADLHAAGDKIPSYAAPIRNKDYAGFPPTITFVGTLEPFHKETAQYVEGLRSAGIEVAYRWRIGNMKTASMDLKLLREIPRSARMGWTSLFRAMPIFTTAMSAIKLRALTDDNFWRRLCEESSR